MKTSKNRTHGEYEIPFAGKDGIYVDDIQERLLWVYYNEDAASGGQFVEMHVPYSLVLEAAASAGGDETRFFNLISGRADTELVDIDTEQFEASVKWYLSNEPDFYFTDSETLVRIAQRKENKMLKDRDIYEKSKIVAAYEDYVGMHEQDRYTSWFGDYGLFEIKHGVSEADFNARLSLAMGALKINDVIEYKNSKYNTMTSTQIAEEMTQNGIGGNFAELSPKEQLQQKLEEGVRSVIDSENFKNWLNTNGKLYWKSYSMQNAMLIWMQKPQSTYVMPYERWKDYGRQVEQGAQGAKIFVPMHASENRKGGLFGSVKKKLQAILDNDPSIGEATYRLGSSAYEFTLNRANKLMGLKINGREAAIFDSDEQARRFFDRNIVGKVPIGFTVATVFDVRDVIIPEYLWVKRGYKKEELALDDKGKPVTNKRGEVRIYNTPERQARFSPMMSSNVVKQNPEKMEILFNACVAVCNKKGIPVSLLDKTEDETLRGGASGYFSRVSSEENPNGYIVIDKNLESTEKCSVLMHEMGHADLHKDLELLAQEMGETKIPREMREIQAEAVAYATASSFGIETDTSSFKYLAAYTRGFELQDFKKSLDIIYRETQSLSKAISAELDLRGFNIDLTEKQTDILSLETLKTLSTKYLDFASEHGDAVQAALEELPGLVKENVSNGEILEILRYQKENLDERRKDLDKMLSDIEALNMAQTRAEQNEVINNLEKVMVRVRQSVESFDVLSERYVFIADKTRKSLANDFKNDPEGTLELMKAEYSELKQLSSAQIKYVSTSRFVKDKLLRLLRTSPDAFVEGVVERAKLIPQAAADNGAFVEISKCEKWTDKPFFENGTLCSPIIANKTLAKSESCSAVLRREAEQHGEYFAYTKCYVTVFAPDRNGVLTALHTKVDIGDGTQKNLLDHLSQVCKRGERREVLAKFEEALSEKGDKTKIIVPGSKTQTSQKSGTEKASLAEYKREIDNKRRLCSDCGNFTAASKSKTSEVEYDFRKTK